MAKKKTVAAPQKDNKNAAEPPAIPKVVPFKVKDEHEISNMIAGDIIDIILDDVYEVAKY